MSEEPLDKKNARVRRRWGDLDPTGRAHDEHDRRVAEAKDRHAVVAVSSGLGVAVEGNPYFILGQQTSEQRARQSEGQRQTARPRIEARLERAHEVARAYPSWTPWRIAEIVSKELGEPRRTVYNTMRGHGFKKK